MVSSGRRRGTARRIVGVLLVVVGVIGVARIGWVALAPPPGESPVQAQVAFLTDALDDGAGPQMQQLFPEGEFFLHALTGLAAASSDPSLARDQLAALDSPEVADRFGSQLEPPHGIFHAGWSLLLAVRIAEATGDPGDLADARDRAETVAQALAASETGVPASYPSGYWPCDAVVAGAAVALAADVVDEPELLGQLGAWRDRLADLTDPDLGLLPHRVDAAGLALDGPRGSSQSIIQTSWPVLTEALDGEPDRAAWTAFRSSFVVSVAGLVGVREHPVGEPGGSDVDSGPLLAGVSLSASAVTLAAARANGDTALAADLDREAELLGMPWQLGSERRYAAGLVPVGDAFLAWARATPAAPDELPATGPRVLWPLIALPWAVLLALGVWLLKPRRA